MQGYYYSRPIPADAVTKYLKTPPLQVAQPSIIDDRISPVAPRPVKRNGLINKPKLQGVP
jgi:hypothetical protein